MNTYELERQQERRQDDPNDELDDTILNLDDFSAEELLRMDRQEMYDAFYPKGETYE